MLQKLFTFLCLVIVILSGCKKEMTAQNDSQNNEFATSSFSDEASATGVVDTSKGWYGSYAGYDGPYQTVPDSLLIKNKVAKDPNIAQSFLFSNITYDIPAGYQISADSLYFEATAKNLFVDPSYNGSDVVLQINGTAGNAELHFVSNTGVQQYDHVNIGDKYIYGLPQLVHYFPDFEIVKFIMKNNEAFVFLNDSMIYKFHYGAQNSIGFVKTINVAGKGLITCDGVRLFNSYTHRRILTENFNTSGKSHTILY